MNNEEKIEHAKGLLREWKATHHEEYCNFTDWMHDREGPGFIAVFNHAKAFMGSSRKHGAYVKLGN